MLYVEARQIPSPCPRTATKVQDFLDLTDDDVVDLDYVDEAAW